MIDKILAYVRRGWGLAQLMEELELDQATVLELMNGDNSFRNKMLKRFSDKWLRAEEAPAETPEPEEPVLDLEALKAQATELGIKFNANIGAKTLNDKIAAFIEANGNSAAPVVDPIPEEPTEPEAPAETPEGGNDDGHPE